MFSVGTFCRVYVGFAEAVGERWGEQPLHHPTRSSGGCGHCAFGLFQCYSTFSWLPFKRLSPLPVTGI